MSFMLPILLFFLYYILFVNGISRCGVPDNSYYIVGGQSAEPMSWPWMALLSIKSREIKTNDTVSYRCGGTIINDRWILTAAHCVEDDPGEELYKIIIKLGKHSISQFESSEVDLESNQFIKHEYFNGDTDMNDIALIKLNKSLDFLGIHKHLKPICLPEDNYSINSSLCYATGWGDTKYNGSFSTTLQEVRLPIMNNTYCSKSREGLKIKYYPELMLCAGYEEGGKDACQGDSGGPLVCPTEDGTWIQYGITSFGTRCALKGRPGVFTRVSRYVKWIKDKIRD